MKEISNLGMIDWKDRNDKISEYFYVGEALYLPKWQIYHIPSDTEKENILQMAQTMDIIRAFIAKPIVISCWLRPDKVNRPGKYHWMDYNAAVGGALNSAHIHGLAVDWVSPGTDCDKMRELLLPKLEEWKIRMEDKPKAKWVHTDLYPVSPNGHRFFKP